MIKLRAIADCTIQLEKVRIDGSSEILFGILAHLIVERGKPVPKTRLVDAFWWNADDAEGRHCLRQTVYKLRQLGAPIESTADNFSLGERAALADFDCADERTLALSPLPPEEAVAIFPGYAPRASAPFLTWLERTREKAGRSIRGVLVRALGEARRRNGWDEAAKLARQCLALDPLNEEATLTLAEYTALQGDKREALRLIDSYMQEIGGTYGDLRIPASLLRNRISERVAYPPASAAGKIPIVGRDDSLRLLAGVSAEVNGGAGQTCVIHGPPGIGKTRLLTEFANISAMKGARIVRVDCHADAAERALSVFMELAPQLLRMPGALGCSPEALRLVRRLGHHDPNERLDPDEYGGAAFLHAAVRASLRDLIDAIAAERPLYLLIEDVHWIDPVSLEVLKEIIGSNRGRQLLVLMTTRTLGDGTLLEGVDRRQLIVHELSPLGDDAARRLAETLCGALAIPPSASLVDWCMQRGAGNPLFMTELLAHWRETKDTERVPASLEALIDERVGALSEAGLRTLQAIALLEGEATYEMLEAVLGMQRWQVMGCVEELDKGGLVVGTASGHIAHRHELIGAAASTKVDSTNRTQIHHRIATEFQRKFTASGNATAAWLAAEHFARAKDITRATELSLAGARHLEVLGAHSQAAEMLHRILRYISNEEQRLVILDARRKLLQTAMRYTDVIRNSEEAILITHRGNEGSQVHNDHELALYSAMHQAGAGVGDVEKVLLRMFGCATAVAASPGHRLQACIWGMATTTAAGSLKDADRFRDALRNIPVETRTDAFLAAKAELIYHTIFGSLDLAILAANEIAALVSELAPSERPSAIRIGGYPYRLVGRMADARQRFEWAANLAEQHALPCHQAQAIANCATILADEGDFDAAWMCFERALGLVKLDPGGPLPPLVLLGSELAFQRGDFAKGKELLSALPEGGPSRFVYEIACLRLYVAHREGRTQPRELDRLRRAHLTFRALGWQDFPTAAIALALNDNDPEAATRFVRDYSQERRERWPIQYRALREVARFPS